MSTLHLVILTNFNLKNNISKWSYCIFNQPIYTTGGEAALV